jgi:lipopolysaccharide transport system permease protein
MAENNTRKEVKRIHAGTATVQEYMSEMWMYRHMIVVFLYQDIKSQYVQTRLNLLWIVIRPLVILIVFTLIFDKLIHIQGLTYPYPLFAFSGLIMWSYFSYLINNVGTVLIANQNILRKIYFPKYLLLISKTLSGLLEMLVSFAIILVMMALYRYPLRATVIFIPVFIFINLMLGLMVATWLNIFNTRYRDLNQIIPSLFSFLIWLTPVFFPATLLPVRYAFVIYFNPVAGAIQGFRWALLGDSFALLGFIPGFVVCGILFLLSIVVFIKREAKIADYI